MSRRVRELVRGGGGRLEREGECCSAAEGRRDDDMLAGSGEVLLLLRSPYALRRAVYAGRFHSLAVQARCRTVAPYADTTPSSCRAHKTRTVLSAGLGVARRAGGVKVNEWT